MIKPVKYTATIIAFILIGNMSLLAQDGEPSEMDELYVPDENSIFGSDGDGDDGGGSYAYAKNVIKFNPTLITRSIIAVFYERYLEDDISFKIGLGTCFGKDRILGVEPILRTFGNKTSDISLWEILNEGTHNNSGGNIFISIASRFFLDTYYNNNSYFEVSLRYYSNRLTAQNDLSLYSNYFIGTPEVDVRNSTFFMTYGAQLISRGTITTFHEFYFGIGIKNTSYNIITRETGTVINFSGNSYTTNVYVISPTDRESILGFSIIIGYILGFGF